MVFLDWRLAAVMPEGARRDKPLEARRLPRRQRWSRLWQSSEQGWSCAMDWDDIVPKKPKTNAAVGDSLATLSVAELEARIAEFEREIERVKVELDAKRKHEAAASALFKK
jgi:uncharacterized small protein (DUF1192 family)